MFPSNQKPEDATGSHFIFTTIKNGFGILLKMEEIVFIFIIVFIDKVKFLWFWLFYKLDLKEFLRIIQVLIL